MFIFDVRSKHFAFLGMTQVEKRSKNLSVLMLKRPRSLNVNQTWFLPKCQFQRLAPFPIMPISNAGMNSNRIHHQSSGRAEGIWWSFASELFSSRWCGILPFLNGHRLKFLLFEIVSKNCCSILNNRKLTYNCLKIFGARHLNGLEVSQLYLF